ncbi:hypothetical protein RFI_11666 [Reticulomyxa filosa]|uniref:Sulfatase N-terminal domain-containing protein n=1 Tax=Reticulomyxa filosa TaxID=46433 RepID=X6NGN6_RETFI|nr:hypothetical protein RFI_11666 [Reticulomyxa filosa]|eukprot:ETO25475.1 hypothetical protein RFI_11666 [Reticulomyxa filosa]
MVAANPPLTEYVGEFLDVCFRTRILSLLSVDDIIQDLVTWLTDHDILNNTYILYTSDHGYHLGQWRLMCPKRQMYQTDIHVPLYIRGPTIPAQSYTDILAANVDLTPTILDLLGLTIPSSVDGKLNLKKIKILLVVKCCCCVVHTIQKKKRSFASWIGNYPKHNRKESSASWRDVFLFEYREVSTGYGNICITWIPNTDGTYFPGQVLSGPSTNPEGIPYIVADLASNSYRGLRILNATQNWSYGEFVNTTWTNASLQYPNFYELYDLNTDPFQMKNIYDTLTAQVKAQLHNMIMSYGSCQGQSCP